MQVIERAWTILPVSSDIGNRKGAYFIDPERHVVQSSER